MRVLLRFSLVVLLAACGQKGPLVLPTGTAASAAAAASQPAR